MNIVCRFKVNRLELSMGSRGVPDPNKSGQIKYENCVLHTVVMTPVYGGNNADHPNFKFWSATPSGEFKMSCIHEGLFELDQEYDIVISKVKKEE